MIPTDKFFSGKREVEYEGKRYCRYLLFDEASIYCFKFRFVSTNSPYIQSINVTFANFRGEVFLNNEKISIKKGKFSTLTFCEDTAPREFVLRVNVKQGFVMISNSSRDWQRDATGNSKWLVCAMIVDNIGKNVYRCYCNDQEYDEDFNDLIFEMEILDPENTVT